MDVLTNRVDRSQIKRGDHIYTYRALALFSYSHHGIFVGGNRVAHFSPERNSNSNSSTWISSDSSFCKSAVICSSYPECGFRQPNSGVLRSCLDCFLGNGSLYRFKYGVTRSFFLAQVRGGTCSIANSDPREEVIHRTMYLLQSGFGNYDVVGNNCEDFALYCKTGLRVVPDRRNRTETGNTGDNPVGGSGQSSSFIGVPFSAIVCSTLKWLVPVSMATAAVGYAGMYCMARYITDIGVRDNVIKVAVEDLAENMGWVGDEAYFVQKNSVLVPILDGTNFTEWSKHVQFHLGFLDLDLAFRINKPHAITDSSNAEEKVMYKSWERSNRLSIMYMRNTIENDINSILPECDNAKEFFKTVKNVSQLWKNVSTVGNVPILDGTNFTKWSKQVWSNLGFLDLDLALQINKPHAITDSSNAEERATYKSWERSNKLSIMFMRNTIENDINSILPECDNAKEFFETVEKRFQPVDNCFYGRARIRQYLTHMLVFSWVIIVSVVGLWLMRP